MLEKFYIGHSLTQLLSLNMIFFGSFYALSNILLSSIRY